MLSGLQITLFKVVEMAPHHYNARLQLSKIMRSLGRPGTLIIKHQYQNYHLRYNYKIIFRDTNKYIDFFTQI